MKSSDLGRCILRVPSRLRSSSFEQFSVSIPSRLILPLTILPGGGTSRMTDKPRVHLPHPDSPTRPRVSPVLTDKETRSTALAFALRVRYSTVSDWMFSVMVLRSLLETWVEEFA